MPRTYYVIAGNNRTYTHEPKHSFEERVFGSYPSKAKAGEVAKALFFTGRYDSVRVTHKNWNTVKGTKVWNKKQERYNTLKRMNDFILYNLNDKYLIELATEDDNYKDICNIIKRYLQYEEGDITLSADLYLF